jgi:hypothetical protein
VEEVHMQLNARVVATQVLVEGEKGMMRGMLDG